MAIGAGWRKSTFSQTDECVEVRHRGGMILVRDSKNPRGPLLQFTDREWKAFIQGAHVGEFDLPEIQQR
jgi:hypothetical protein